MTKIEFISDFKAQLSQFILDFCKKFIVDINTF